MENDEIIVEGHRYFSAAYIFPGNDPAPHNPDPGLDPDGPPPPDPSEESTDRTDLAVNQIVTAPLTNTSNFYLILGNGHILKITVDNNLIPSWSFAREQISKAVGVLLRSYYGGDQSVRDRIEALDNLVFTDVQRIWNGLNLVPGRSTSYEPDRTFFYDVAELNASPGFIASNIYHDAGHIQLYLNNNNNIYASRGASVEQNLVGDQIQLASLFGLTANETVHLINYKNDPAAIQARIEARPAG